MDSKEQRSSEERYILEDERTHWRRVPHAVRHGDHAGCRQHERRCHCEDHNGEEAAKQADERAESPEQNAGCGYDFCDSNDVRSRLDREEVIHPASERAMLHVNHNLSALSRREFEGSDPEHDRTQTEGADETWQV